MKVKISVALLLIGATAAAVVAGGYVYFLQIVKTPHNQTAPIKKIIAVAPGQGVKEIAAQLEQEEIIADDFYFNLYVRITRTEKRFQAGEFELTSAMNIPQIVGTLISGATLPREARITVPEGFTAKEIRARLEENNLFVGDAFLTLNGYQDRYSFLADAPALAGMEGFLFPDTYHFFKKSSAEDIVKKFLDNFEKKLSDNLREELKRRQRTIFEAVITASLIEKEVARDPDRAIVSGILWKRLSVGMPLQVDATVCYAKTQEFKNCHPILKDDLEIVSSYNTYQQRGLPPGPISNPGLAALEAAVFPQESEYWYYLSKPDGETVFSKTLEEHNRARALYLPR